MYRRYLLPMVPDLTASEIRKIIAKTASLKDGFKVLDAEAALKEALKQRKGQ